MPEAEAQYVVATIKPWNVDAFHAHASALPGQWHLVETPEQLTVDWLERIDPRYIFFPHWSWRVSPEIFARWECVCFHMSDVPYGRGGSPLQNLIARGHTETRLTALQMVEELDAGPVYLKTPLSLEGSAADIYARAATGCYQIMRQIVDAEPVPEPQQGDVVSFPRRSPAMSALPVTEDVSLLYDHIRMLDAETYPRAYLNIGPMRMEFSNATLDETGLSADIHITTQATQKEAAND